jgi:hypothetical protein
LLEEGNQQAHVLEVLKHTTHKVMNDAIFYARIQVNNAYYKEVLVLKMNKKLCSLVIYLNEKQCSQVKISKSFIFNI